MHRRLIVNLIAIGLTLLLMIPLSATLDANKVAHPDFWGWVAYFLAVGGVFLLIRLGVGRLTRGRLSSTRIPPSS